MLLSYLKTLLSGAFLIILVEALDAMVPSFFCISFYAGLVYNGMQRRVKIFTDKDSIFKEV